MDKFIEKIKGIDKKILIGIAVAVAVLIVAIVAIAIGSGDKHVSPSSDNEGTSSTDTFNADVNENEDNSNFEEESSSVEDESSTDEESSTGEDESTSKDDSQNTDNNDNTEGTTAVQQPTATNPSGEEILGAGSKDQPYLEYPGDDFAVKTVSIPAGKELYYDIYRVGGMYLTIEDSNAYVICEGTKYTAKNGKVSFKVPNALASDSVSFQIGNSGSTAKSFTIKFANLKGSYANPEKITKLDGNIEKSLSAGVETGYYYKYNAEKTGTIRFYIVEQSAKSILVVTNNRNSTQRTTDVEEDVLTDENGKQYIEIEVQKGDELMINIGALPNKRGKYPAVEITWCGEYK